MMHLSWRLLGATALLRTYLTTPSRLTTRGARSRFKGAGPEGERGSLTLEQAVITAVLVGAAIALGIVIVAAIGNHSSKIN